ncbi:MAG TPA: hypothetical protein VJS92_11080 [Candidatus Polarisedimenticolaceae bacterium]|nr:hypothetical protein [Candidatus Polarisedimenticolaceae bacterium]
MTERVRRRIDKGLAASLAVALVAGVIALMTGCGGVRSRELTVPAGVVLTVEFEDAVPSAAARPGDRFRASVVQPVYADDRVAIPAGARVSGEVVRVAPRLSLRFTSLELPSGRRMAIEALSPSEGVEAPDLPAGTRLRIQLQSPARVEVQASSSVGPDAHVAADEVEHRA